MSIYKTIHFFKTFLLQNFKVLKVACWKICNLSTLWNGKVMHGYIWWCKVTNIVNSLDTILFPVFQAFSSSQSYCLYFLWFWHLAPSGQNQFTILNFPFHQTRIYLSWKKKHMQADKYFKYVHKWKRAERSPKAFCDIFRQFFHLHVRYIIAAIPTDKSTIRFHSTNAIVLCLFVTFQLILYIRLFTYIRKRKPVHTLHTLLTNLVVVHTQLAWHACIVIHHY